MLIAASFTHFAFPFTYVVSLALTLWYSLSQSEKYLMTDLLFLVLALVHFSHLFLPLHLSFAFDILPFPILPIALKLFSFAGVHTILSALHSARCTIIQLWGSGTSEAKQA